MARPSFRRRRLAGESGGGRDGYLCTWHRPRQERLQRGWVGCVRRGCVMRRKVRRETIALAEKLPPCVVGMEACCGAHHLGRVFAAHGHDVRLMSPEYVRPYLKAQ